MKSRVFMLMLSALAVTCILGMETAQKSKSTGQTERNEIVYKTSNDSFTADNVEIYYTKTQKNFDRVTEILKHRKGKIVIEIIDGIVLDDSGNGKDVMGDYIRYDTDRFSKSDRVQSVFVYNPENNFLDDTVYRIDTLIE